MSRAINFLSQTDIYEQVQQRIFPFNIAERQIKMKSKMNSYISLWEEYISGVFVRDTSIVTEKQFSAVRNLRRFLGIIMKT